MAESKREQEVHVLESSRRLSESMIWDLQRKFFEQKGVDAWRDYVVPQYVTSNAFIAGAYAKIVYAFLQDWGVFDPAGASGDAQPVSDDSRSLASLARLPGGAAPSSQLDAGQPIYIIELGAGSGRFAHYFLKKFLERVGDDLAYAPPIRYIMTDLAQKNVDHWRHHTSFQPFVARGLLDFARFDAESDRILKLEVSGDVLSPGVVRNPILLLANYFFDSLPLDVFEVERGALMESLVTVSSTQPAPDPADPGILEHLEVQYTSAPCSQAPYQEPELNAILEEYRGSMAGTAIRFPSVALRCCQFFRELGGGRMLLLSGDKGLVREDSLLNLAPPGLVRHGSVSFSVNYHAIGRYFANLGGQYLQPAHDHSSIAVVAFLLGSSARGRSMPAYPNTRQAYYDVVQSFGPDDFFALRRGIDLAMSELTMDQLLAYLRFAACDPDVLGRCLERLVELAPSALERQKRALYRLVERAWDLYFFIGEREDLAFRIGRLLHKMDYYPEAAAYYQRSRELHGPDSHVAFNLAVCHYRQRQFQEALVWVEEALARDPEHDMARVLRIELQSLLGGPTPKGATVESGGEQGSSKAGQARGGKAKAGQARGGKAKAGQARGGKAKVGQKRGGKAKAGGVRGTLSVKGVSTLEKRKTNFE